MYISWIFTIVAEFIPPVNVLYIIKVQVKRYYKVDPILELFIEAIAWPIIVDLIDKEDVDGEVTTIVKWEREREKMMSLDWFI